MLYGFSLIPCVNPKFRVEIENPRGKSQISDRNFKILCGISKSYAESKQFRVEIENSAWNLRIPVQNCEIPIGTFIGTATVNVFPQPAG